MKNLLGQPQKMMAKLAILSVLWVSSASLEITCCGKRHQPYVAGYKFKGCFVTKGDIAYEILGNPPANISGPYGTLFLSGLCDCQLHLSLNNEALGVYKCGVLFDDLQSMSNKAVFSHFTIKPEDISNKTTNCTPTNPVSTQINDIDVETSNMRKLTGHNEKLNIILATIVFVLVGLLLITLSQKRQENVTEQNVVGDMIEMESPEIEESVAYSYPTTPRQRDQANNTLSTMGLMLAPSPPPLAISFPHIIPTDLFKPDRSENSECSCMDKRL